jgi:hypothetical protein
MANAEGNVGWADGLTLLCPMCQNPLVEWSCPNSDKTLPPCPTCHGKVSVLHGIPVLRKVDEEIIDLLDTPDGLAVYDSSNLSIPFIQEALVSEELVLELGAGADICDKPNLIKTDSYLYSTSLDFIADAHALPFGDDTFGYVFSLAVFEHLHSPWIAADEIFRVLKPGGKVFVLTAFMQHLHGYPSHFFNMTLPGLRRLFERFDIVDAAPSSWTSFDQLSYLLLDFLTHAKESCQSQESISSKEKLERAVRDFCECIPLLDHELLRGDASESGAWAKIAPTIELEACKHM